MQIALPVIVLSMLGILFGAGLAWAGKIFAVEEDPKVVAVRDVLPGANCGACGFPGCDGLAMAIASGQASLDACPVGGGPCVAQIAQIMGVSFDVVADQPIATVICQGKTGVCATKYTYAGAEDCRAAVLASGGDRACRYACLGLGTCVRNCPFGAITIVEGLAQIDPAKCTGCGNCTAVCPKNVLRMQPRHKVAVLCRASEKGKAVRDSCTMGCIACGKCSRTCQHDAIVLKDNLPSIDYDKCIQCLDCARVCPTGAMWGEGVREEKEKEKAAKENAAAQLQ